MTEFKYTINTNTLSPIMLIDDSIGLDENGNGIDASQFMRELLFLDNVGYNYITIMINSYGGYVSEGQQIFTAILNCKTEIKTQVMGVAASIAAVIFEAGHQRIVSDYSILMFHDPSGGNSKALINFKEAIIAMCSKTKLPRKKISDLMSNETWMNGNDSQYAGIFWDIMLETGKVKDLTNVDMVLNSAKQIIDKIKNDNDMDIRIKEKIGLSINSTDDEVLSKLDELMSRNELEITVEESNDVEEMNSITIKNNIKIYFKDCLKTGTEIFTKNEMDEYVKLEAGTYDFLDEKYTYIYQKTITVNEVGEIENISENEIRENMAINGSSEEIINEILDDTKIINDNIDNIVIDNNSEKEININIDTLVDNISINTIDNLIDERDNTIEMLKNEILTLKDRLESIENKEKEIPAKGINLRTELNSSVNDNSMGSLMSKIYSEKNKIK